MRGRQEEGGGRGSVLAIPKLLNCPTWQRLCDMFELRKIHQTLIIIANWGSGRIYIIEIPIPIISISASPSLPQSC